VPLPTTHRRMCSHGAAVLDPVFTGWYLRVADKRYGPGTTFLAIGYWSPYGRPVWRPNAVTSVAVIGRIAPATGPPAAECGPLPLPPNANPHNPSWCSTGHTGSRCATATISSRGVAEVWCRFSRCQVAIQATRRQITVRYTTTVFPFARLTLPGRLITRLGHGPALMKISIDGRRFKSGRVTL
jgi:hypothetical protein